MRHLERRGFTLAELLVAIVLFSVVAGSIVRLLVTNQRAFGAQAEHVDMQQNMRTAGALLPTELREVDAGDGDIEAMSATAITIRAMRRLGIACDPPILGGVLTGLTLTVRKPIYSSTRDFAAGDSLLVWYEGDPTTRADDSWVLGKVTAVATVPCTDGSAGQQLTVSLLIDGTLTPPQQNFNGAIPAGAPVRGFEVVTYRSYLAPDNRWYVALDNSQGVAPVVGPLTGNTGFTLTYADSTGAATSIARRVARIGIALQVQSANKVHFADGSVGYAVDSVSTAVVLRNNPRF
ncbi:MAG: hypothetical protein NVS1B4_24810 [Gemmatimonadaceae bacterium]